MCLVPHEIESAILSLMIYCYRGHYSIVVAVHGVYYLYHCYLIITVIKSAVVIIIYFICSRVLFSLFLCTVLQVPKRIHTVARPEAAQPAA